MSLFPLFLKLDGRLAVVVGGGSVAETKITSLLAAGARVRVIAPKVTERIAGWAREGSVSWISKEFEPADLDGASLVIAATSAPGVNELVYQAADPRGILCNAVDDPSRCHFYYGAVVQRGDLQIAISTNGKSPALAQRLRQELEAQFGPEYREWLESLGFWREIVLAGDGDAEDKRRALHFLASQEQFEKFRFDTFRKAERSVA